MIKRLLAISIMLVLLNSGTLLAGGKPDLAMLKENISKMEANKQKSAGLMNMLNGLKIDAGAGMWNFLGRNGNEKNIQKRNLILREISKINVENENISKLLLDSREAVIMEIGKNPASNSEYIAVLDYLDSLAVKEASGFEFLSGSDINSSDKSTEHMKFLRYKLDMQAQKLRKVETLINYFITKKSISGVKSRPGDCCHK
jgi:hypothetical protein